jgi:hypothetical protein
MTFGSALVLLKAGSKISRETWGNTIWLELRRGRNGKPHKIMRATAGSRVPWLATSRELLVEDWVLITP